MTAEVFLTHWTRDHRSNKVQSTQQKRKHDDTVASVFVFLQMRQPGHHHGQGQEPSQHEGTSTYPFTENVRPVPRKGREWRLHKQPIGPRSVRFVATDVKRKNRILYNK